MENDLNKSDSKRTPFIQPFAHVDNNINNPIAITCFPQNNAAPSTVLAMK